MKVNIIDALMGCGKTSAAINFINSSNDDVKFMYITPYLTEVKRIIESCPSRKFKQPETFGTKIKGIKYLLENGSNIVSTHALFSLFDEEIIDLAYTNNYTLIMDEVADTIEQYDIKKDDLETLLEKYVKIEKNGILKWCDEDYAADKFMKERNLCNLNCLAYYSNTLMMWLFPISTFRAFRDIYILTYMFNAQTQKYYYDYFGIEYNYMYVDGDNISNYKFVNEKIDYAKVNYGELIHIIDNDKLNQIGDLETALSKGWYERNQGNKLIKQLKNATGNFFKNYTKTKSCNNLWTCFKKYKDLVAGKGYAKGFLSSNMRATNEYKDRYAVAYLINKYFNPCIRNFFVKNGVEVDDDAFAVSEMLQFIWRSAIRENNEIWLYIPSSRMRMLLEKWIKEISSNI